MVKLPDDKISKKVTDSFLTQLWSDLEHPPKALLGDRYSYRQPDGSFNNFLNTKLGAAHMEYARTVKPQTVQPGSLPDPGVLFDAVLARKESKPHPSRISSMLFYLASIIIHDLFRTNHKDFRVSDTSSYLDLSPLYGSDWNEQKRMRTFKDGKIKPDCFSETRLLSFPPGVGALLIMFNRYHNFIVEQLALINEGGRFTQPKEDDSRNPSDYTDFQNYETGQTKYEKYDNDLFQTGRMIVCGLYVNIILIDYVRTILNLNKADTDVNWQLNPRVDIPGGPDMGGGNQVSAEFNLVYRWHSATSDKDDKWTQDLFKEMFDGRLPSEVPQREFLSKLFALESKLQRQEPEERDFHGLQRHNGSFSDDHLARILCDSVEDCANAFGPRQVPVAMKAIEVLGIQQARAWNLATLNEFRKHFGLTPHRTFDDITQDKEVAEQLKHLYDHPDNVELYPGLVVEDAKKPMEPGSGLCPSYTVSRGVLSDAVALVRGDRFYTTSYHPKALTNWGFSEVSSDLTIDNGCVFYKLFTRTLPNNFEPNSVYAHFPLNVPGEMKRALTKRKKAYKYTFARPTPIRKSQMVFSFAAADQILKDQEAFKVPWGEAMHALLGSSAKGFMLAGDERSNAESRSRMERALYMGPHSRSVPSGNEKWIGEVRRFYEETMTSLLKEKSYKLGKTNNIDIIRDLGNMAHVRFCAEMYNVPLKTADNLHGVFTEQQLHLIVTAVFVGIFFDIDPEHSFPLREKASEASEVLGDLLKLQVSAVKNTGRFANFFTNLLNPSESKSVLKDYGVHMIQRLLEFGTPVDELVSNIMGTVGAMVTPQGQLFGQVMDYLFTEGRQHWPEVQKLAKQDTPEADDKLMRYALEFSRLASETGMARIVAKDVTIKDGDRELKFQPGDKIVVNLKAASRDPAGFPDPEQIKLNRPFEKYMHQGHGPHQCIGLPMATVVLTTMLKVLGKLENLRPAPAWPGPESKVKKVLRKFYEGDDLPEDWHYHAYLTENWDMYLPFPTSECNQIQQALRLEN